MNVIWKYLSGILEAFGGGSSPNPQSPIKSLERQVARMENDISRIDRSIQELSRPRRQRRQTQRR
jgi:exonuclease VII small subunit